MIRLSQRDPRWAKAHLGASNLLVGAYGCTTTVLSMFSDYFGSYLSPGEIAAHNSWYTPAGLVIWTKLAFAKMAFVWREFGENDPKIDAALADVDQAVGLQVNSGKHWIAAVRKVKLANGSFDYMAADPWTGHDCLAKLTYKNITGSVFVKRK